MRNRRIKVACASMLGAALGTTLACGWYLASPGYTVEAMADAAVHGRSDQLVTYMDMPALRSSTRSAGARVIEEQYPTGRVRLDPRKVTEALAGHMIDHIFSVQGTKEIIGRRRPTSTDATVRYRILRQGPNRFTARIDLPRSVDLVFTRHLVQWKLSAINARPAVKPVEIV